jgi:outer membrane protein TolC
MVSRVATFVTILLALLPRPSVAQETLTLDQAVSAALANNAMMRAAKAGEREAAAHVDEARAGYLPRVDYVESWQRGNDPVYVFGSLLTQQRFTAANFDLAALNHPDPLTNHQGMLVVQQPVFDSARLAGIRSAGIGSQIAQRTTAEARGDLSLGVTRVYGMVLQAIAGRRAADAAVESANDDLARTEQRRDAGLVTEADVLSLKVFVAQMQERQIRAASGEEVARAQLNQLMGAPLDTAFVLVEPPPPSVATAQPPSAPADDEAIALKNRAAVHRADAELALADTARTAAKAAFLPQVYVQGMYELNGHTFWDRASAWMVAGQVRFNLFAGGGDAARVKVATAAEARARAERDNVLTSVRLEVRTARAEYDAAVAREAVGRAAVLQARESQRIIRDRYESGLTGVTDVLRAATSLLDAETLRISSIVDVIVGRAALDKAVGRLQ